MRKLTQEEFEEKVHLLLPDITIVDFYVNKRTRIKVRCNKCGNTWTPIADSLLRGHGCSVCKNDGKSGKSKPIIVKGYNDLFTKIPEYARYLKDKNDAFKYTYKSSKKIYWICPHCHSDVLSSVSQVSTIGIKCPYCGDGISYPNKFMYHFLNYFNIDFIREFKIGNFYYDILINDAKIIIEMDGGLHFTDNTMSGQTKEESQRIDSIKDEVAHKAGYKLIRIDSRISELEYLKKSISSSEIIDLLGLTNKINNVDWNEISLKSQNSLFLKTIQLYNNGLTSCEEILNNLPIKVHKTTIYKYLKRGNKLGICGFKPNGNKRMVRCIQDDKIFDSIQQAQDFYNFSNNRGICNSCKQGTSCYVTRNNKRQKINFEYIN